MKSVRILTVTLLVFLCAGCDLIGEGEYQIDYKQPVAEGEDLRNILLEDYTGMRCTNCPAAAEKIVNLQGTFGERLIAVSIHAGSFSRPIGPYDLRCEAGNEYNAYFKVTENPSGVINRAAYNKGLVLDFNQWDEVLDKAPQKTTVAMKKPLVAYDAGARTFTVGIELKSLENHSSYSLILWLVEDKVVTPQETPDGRVNDYVQRHVLRGALNGVWGETISLNPSEGYQLFDKGEYTLEESFKAEDCSIVALVCNEQTKEVVQVAEGKFF